MRRYLWFILLFFLVSCGGSIEETDTIETDNSTSDAEYSEGVEGQAGIGALPSPNAPRKIGDLGVGEAGGTAIGDRAPNSGTLIFLPFIAKTPVDP